MKRGFTLIETISVMAIVFVLSAIMTPVLSRAMLRVKETSSISRLKQLHLALSVYRADYETTMYGKASQMGLPTVEHMLRTGGKALDVDPELWFSPCPRHPDSPSGIWTYNYFPDDDELSWERYVDKYGESSVLLSDFNCNPHALSMGAIYMKKAVLFVRLEGSATKRIREGSPMSHAWYHDD
jgi:prepilin-type N-terminal cleavage/methylation domain-containing protein